MNNYLDRTIINLATLLISGTGIFAALTKFNVPELSKSFWGENPFAIKRDIIDVVMTWIFTTLAVIGFLFQAITFIWGNNIPDRNFGAGTYFTVFSAGSFMMLILVFILTKFGNMLARRRWLPKMIMSHKELYEKARFIVEHDGWLEEQIGREDLKNNPSKYIHNNLEIVDKSFTQIESLLDIAHDKTDSKARLCRLRRYFE
jgi:hypothetical protein